LHRPVPTDEPHGDAEQPRLGRRHRQIEVAPAAEGGEKGVAHDVFRRVGADASRYERAQHTGVTIEELGERIGRDERPLDDVRVARHDRYWRIWPFRFTPP